MSFVSTSTGVIEPQAWDLDGDGACDDATGATARRSYSTSGTYTVKLCVTDGVDSGTLERRVTVRNRDPSASFTYAPTAPLAGDTVTLTSTSADPDGPITSQSWDLDNDGEFDDGAGAVANSPFPLIGRYIVRLSVTDRDGATAVAVAAIDVAARPPALLSPFPIVRLVANVGSRGTRLLSITVKAPADSRVRVECRGRGCPFRIRAHSIRRGKASAADARAAELLRIRRLRRRVLRPGAILAVSVTKPGTIGKYTRFRIRRKKLPRRSDGCLVPGRERPAACPSST